jgi:DMSO reductase anchor subunit
MDTTTPRADGAPLALIGATPQTLWGMPAVLNFSLGGLGAGWYVTAAVLGSDGAVRLAGWLAPGLVLAGFLAVAGEAGRPLRGVRVLRAVATSWMSRELWLGSLFVALALIDAAAPATGLRLGAAAAATTLVLAQGAMLSRARALAAWSVSMMPLVFAASAAVSGGGLLILAELLVGRPPARHLLLAVTAALVAGLLVWLRYLASQDPAFAQATTALREGATAVELIVGGYAAPFVLLALALGLPHWSPVPAALAGALAVVAQFRAKSALILDAGLRRPLTLATLTLPGRRSS